MVDAGRSGQRGGAEPRTRWHFGQYLATSGRIDEAAEQLNLALRDDPLHLLCRSHFAGVLYGLGRHTEAMTHARRVLDMDPNFGVAYWYLAVFHALDGPDADARMTAERAYELRRWDTLTRGLFAAVVARDGDAARAESLLAGRHLLRMALRSHGRCTILPGGNSINARSRSATPSVNAIRASRSSCRSCAPVHSGRRSHG